MSSNIVIDQQSVDMIVLVAGVSADRVRKMLGRLPSSSRSDLCDFYDVETFDELVEEVADRPRMMQICNLKDLGYNVNHGIVKGF